MHEFRAAWGLAAISIVFVSWVLFRYLAPRSWREWTRAGVVQAFLIAFYAEMYGFPVTLYALTRIFRLDARGPLWRDNLWAYLTGTEDVMLLSMILGYTISAFGILLLAASWRQIYRGTKEGRLVTDGAYALVRHPQYTGLFLAIFGEGVVHWPTVFSLAAFPVIVIAYVLLARREEKRMIADFGDAYLAYRRRVPMFIPRPAMWRGFAHGLTASNSASRSDGPDAIAQAATDRKPPAVDRPHTSSGQIRGH